MEDITFPALGRLAFLGQLWTGSKTPLPSPSFWTQEYVKAHTAREAHPFTTIDHQEISSYSERTTFLDIKGAYKVNLLITKLEGSGSYIDTSNASISSNESSISCTFTSYSERIAANYASLTPEWLEKCQGKGATHVVTRIVYGGKYIASFKSKHSTYDRSSQVEGGRLGKMLRSAGDNLQSALKTGGYPLDAAKDAANKLEATFDIFSDPNLDKTPSTIDEALILVNCFPQEVRDALVPFTITLSPISRFVENSPISKNMYTLRNHQVDSIFKLFDSIVTLRGRREELDSAILVHQAMVPSLSKNSQEERDSLRIFVGSAQDMLNDYMTTFRQSGELQVGPVSNLLKSIGEEFIKHQSSFQVDLERLEVFNTLIRLAEAGGAPFIGVNTLHSKILNEKRPLCLVVIPEGFRYAEIKSIFRLKLNHLRIWKEKGRAPDFDYNALFVDSTLIDLLKLSDDHNGTLFTTVRDMTQTKAPVVLFYLQRTKGGQTLDEMGWSVLNQDRIGIIANKEEPSLYVGEIQNRLPHGNGLITYPNQTTYSGEWWSGQRNGEGSGAEGEGVYSGDQFAPDGVMIMLRVYNKGSPITSAKVPLRKGELPPAHIKTITRMMGWGSKDKVKLTIRSNIEPRQFEPLTVLIEGGYSSAEPDSTKWPLSSIEIVAELDF